MRRACVFVPEEANGGYWWIDLTNRGWQVPYASESFKDSIKRFADRALN